MIAIGTVGVSANVTLLREQTNTMEMHANVLIFITIIWLQAMDTFLEVDLVIRSINIEYASLVVWAICTLDQVHTWYQFHALVNFHRF